MPNYTLRDDLLKLAIGDANTPAESGHLKVFKRDGSGDVLANAIADVNGDLVASWANYSDDVIACYYYESGVPYTAPEFTLFYNGATANGTSVSTNGGGTWQTRSEASTDLVIETKTNKKYLWFVSSLTNVSSPALIGFVQDGWTNDENNQDHGLLGYAGYAGNWLMGGTSFQSGGTGVAGSGHWYYLDCEARTFNVYQDGNNAPRMTRSWSEAEALNIDDYMRVHVRGDGTLTTDVLFDSADWQTSPPSVIPDGWVRVGESGEAATKHPPQAIITKPVEVI